MLEKYPDVFKELAKRYPLSLSNTCFSLEAIELNGNKMLVGGYAWKICI